MLLLNEDSWFLHLNTLLFLKLESSEIKVSRNLEIFLDPYCLKLTRQHLLGNPGAVGVKVKIRDCVLTRSLWPSEQFLVLYFFPSKHLDLETFYPRIC